MILGVMFNGSITTLSVILACFDQASQTREFFWRANENGMATEEYVYIIMSLKSTGFGSGNTLKFRIINVF